MSRRGVSLVLGFALLATSACSRDEDRKNPRDISLGPRAQPSVGQGVSTAPVATTYKTSPSFGSDPSEETTAPPPAAPAPPAASAAAPKTNPDDAILERSRVACGACFSSLRAGPGMGPPTRSAHVSLTVLPSGEVSRADATSNDTNEADVLSCIESTAGQARFSDNGGGPLRTYAIDVRVSAVGANGSR